MPIFRYEAINPAGRMVSGTRPATLIQEVESWLEQEGLSPVDIRLFSVEEGAQVHSAAEARASLRDRLFGIGLEDKILFCRQLSTLLNAGVSIIQSFDVLKVQVANPMLRDIIVRMESEIENGASLSDAVSVHPKVFNTLFHSMVRVGEETGSLDRAFAYLAALYENEKIVRERIKSATRYPKIVITAVVLAVFFLMSFVVPKFAKLFASAKVELPLPTKILMAVSGFFAENTLMIIALAIALFTLYRLALNSRECILFRDRLLLRVPIFGPLGTRIYMGRFCRVFALLTRSGIGILKTMNLSASALENLVLYDLVGEMADEVERGGSLHEAMARRKAIPPMVAQMLAIGEQSGRIDEMMEKVAEYYEVESEYTIKNLSTLIEPILLLIMGVMVGGIALAIFLPMWNMMNVMRGG